MMPFIERKIRGPVGVWADGCRYHDHEKLTDLADQCARGVVHLLKDVYPDPDVRQVCRNIDGACAANSNPLVVPTQVLGKGSALGLAGMYGTERPGQFIQLKVSVARDEKKVLVDIGVVKDRRLLLVISTRLIQPSVYNTLSKTLRKNNRDQPDFMRFLTGPLRLDDENTETGWKLKMPKVGEIEVHRETPRTYDCFAGHTFDSEFTNKNGNRDAQKGAA